MKPSSYVLITAACNEEKYIEKTIRSVCAQSIVPKRWVIVSDGSTDSTDQIIKAYCRSLEFLKYARVEHVERNEADPAFGRVARRKAAALQVATELMSDVSYEYIGNIDADVSVEPDCFERLIRELVCDPQLGIVGGFIYNVVGERLAAYFVNSRNVGGPLQLFRNTCFIDIGARYMPYGHEDTVALISARMKGWRTRSVADIKIYHYKVAPQNGRARCRTMYRLGVYDYLHGDSALWVVARCIKELRTYPVLLGSCMRLGGYIRGALRGRRVVSTEMEMFVQREQRRLIRRVVLDRVLRRKGACDA